MRRSKKFILVEGARQNTLKNVTVRLPIGELTVVSGVSGSGKSSFAFDTVYAEGQRRYVETFSPYARQFLERMDRPRVDRVDGIPPAIAIDQTNPVRTSRSTVGTMTELADHLKLLYARAARLFCDGCGREVRRDSPETIADALMDGPGPHRPPCGPGGGAPPLRATPPLLLVTFPVPMPANVTREEMEGHLARQGYTRVRQTGEGSQRRFSTDLHCPDCDRHYADPTPGLFSFNSPVGACPGCRGFGRTIGIDLRLVIPDESLTLRGGAIRPWQSGISRECQTDLALPGVLRRTGAPPTARRGGGSAVERDSHPARVPGRRRPRLPDARSAVANAFRRRSPAHQPDDRAGHLAREHPVRSRRAERGASPPRHPAGDRHPAPAARWFSSGRRRISASRDVRSRRTICWESAWSAPEEPFARRMPQPPGSRCAAPPSTISRASTSEFP